MRSSWRYGRNDGRYGGYGSTGIKKRLLLFARILAVASSIFLMLFGLDVFGYDVTIGAKLVAFWHHCWYAIVLFLSVFIFWKVPYITGIIAIGAGVYLEWLNHFNLINFLMLSGPPILAGILLFVGYARYRKSKRYHIW